MSEYKVAEKKDVEKPVVRGDLIIEQHGNRVSLTIRDITPDGVKIELDFEGQTKGKVEGRYFGTSTLVQKIDKTIEMDTKIIENTRDGDIIIYYGKGHGKMSPEWNNWQAEVEFMTTSPKYAWLNGKKGLVEGLTQHRKRRNSSQNLRDEIRRPDAPVFDFFSFFFTTKISRVVWLSLRKMSCLPAES